MPVTVEIRRASQGFFTRSRERETRHSFSFGEHYDPGNVGFGALVCHDDHRLRPGTGFPEHAHTDVEIVTWVLDGAVAHTDSTGATTLVTPGTVQVQSAGSGITHSELGAEGVGPTRFIQAWLRPDETGTTPTSTIAAVGLPPGLLVPVVSGHDPAAVARIGTTSATFSVARLAAGDTVTLPDEPLQHVFVGRGALIRSSLAEPLSAGDAFRITDRPGLALTAAVPTELLVWTFTR